MVSVKNSGTVSAISNPCAFWPKNIQASFPNAVKVNEEFDVRFEYTYIVYEPGDVAESSLTGIPPARDDAEDLLENPRAECIDTRVYLIMSDSLDLITDGVFEESRTSTRTDRVTNFYHIDYAFNNTAKQTQNITLRFNSLPDRYDGSLLLGTAGNPVNVVHFTDNNGTIYLESPPSYRNAVDVRGASVSSVSALERIKSDFYAKDIALPERDFVIRYNSTNLILPEDLAGIVELHNVTDVGAPAHAEVPFPRKQLESGVHPWEIRCSGDRVLVTRDGGSPACVYADTAAKTGWIPVNIARSPAVRDYGEVHEPVINSIRVGGLGEPAVLNVTIINHAPEVAKNPVLNIRAPDSFEVDRSQEYYRNTIGVGQFPPRYSAYFGTSDVGLTRLDLGNVTFYPTETGTYEMSILNRTAAERNGSYSVWFVIGESDSYWSYDEPARQEARDTDERTEPAVTMQDVQLTDSEVDRFLRDLSARHGTEVTVANVLEYISEDDEVYVMKGVERADDRLEEVLLFFKEVPYDG